MKTYTLAQESQRNFKINMCISKKWMAKNGSNQPEGITVKQLCFSGEQWENSCANLKVKAVKFVNIVVFKIKQ